MVIYRGRGSPDINTPGNVDDLYIDLDSDDVYRCKDVVVSYNSYGFVSIRTRESSNAQYIWELDTSVGDTLILVDENGYEVAAVMTDEEVDLTATANDIREGIVAVTDDGVITGTKEIPSYHTSFGWKIVTDGSKFVLRILDYEYTKLQVVFCLFNTSMDDSVAAEKVVIDDNLYSVRSTEVESNVVVDTVNGYIDFGITNESGKPYILRYSSYKEIY